MHCKANSWAGSKFLNQRFEQEVILNSLIWIVSAQSTGKFQFWIPEKASLAHTKQRFLLQAQVTYLVQTLAIYGNT